MIVRGYKELLNRYNEMSENDIYIGNIVSKNLNHYMMIDLLERGVRCLPSFIAQTLNGSKVAQAVTLKKMDVSQYVRCIPPHRFNGSRQPLQRTRH